jgi:hypothetical protein
LTEGRRQNKRYPYQKVFQRLHLFQNRRLSVQDRPGLPSQKAGLMERFAQAATGKAPNSSRVKILFIVYGLVG